MEKSKKTIVLVGRLDSKGNEYAFIRDRILAGGFKVIVVDAGSRGTPLFEADIPREEVAFKIAEEIIYGKFGHLDECAAAEQAIRTALAILTEGITAAPVQGVAQVLFKFNPDGTKYLAIYFAGPIRSAGGTEQALTLVVGDFIRRLIGLNRYKPTQEEIARFIEEVRLFEREVARFQYHVSDEELTNSSSLSRSR